MLVKKEVREIENQTVDPEVGGSRPLAHPNTSIYF